MDFEGFTSVDFSTKSDVGFVYVLCCLDKEGKFRFTSVKRSRSGADWTIITGQTSKPVQISAWGRLLSTCVPKIFESLQSIKPARNGE